VLASLVDKSLVLAEPQGEAMRIFGVEAEQVALHKLPVSGVDNGNSRHRGSDSQSCNAGPPVQSKRVWIHEEGA